MNMQAALRKQAEDAAVRRAKQTGSFVEVAVHSFIPRLPPSVLTVPEDATIEFLKRQIQYRIAVWSFARTLGRNQNMPGACPCASTQSSKKEILSVVQLRCQAFCGAGCWRQCAG